MKTVLYITYGILIGLLAAAIIWVVASSPRGAPVTLLPTPQHETVTVYVTGAVATPGVYTLSSGSRVQDAIQAAGGFLPSADKEVLNMASLLQDELHISVPEQQVAEGGGPININTATTEEFDTLPGIGPSTAQSIVEYRDLNGLFISIEDIQNVPGIGLATFEQIRRFITVGP